MALMLVTSLLCGCSSTLVTLSPQLSNALPLDVCIFLGDFDPRTAGYVIGARNSLIEKRTLLFHDVTEVSGLEDAKNCDVAVRISQPGFWRVRADVFSTKSKDALVSFEASGSNAGSEIANAVYAAFAQDTQLGKRLIEEHSYRTAKNTGGQTVSNSDEVASINKEATLESSAFIKSDIDSLPTAQGKSKKNAYAIVIGIETYRQKLPKADFAAQDAKLVTDYLTKVMGYPEENVITLLNDRASNVDIAKYFEKWLPNNVEPGSTVFVYYSGHGAPNPNTSDAYLVPYDGDPSFIEETGYSLKRMYTALGKLPAKEVIIALDTCFSGAGGRSVIAKGARPLVMNLQNNMVPSKNMTVLSASSGVQISSTYDEKGHGLFTYFLLKGIKNENVTRSDGSLKLDDLFSYIRPQVERIARKQYNNEQTPQLLEPKRN
jgi:hypothetical protein